MFWILLALVLCGLAAVPVWLNSRRAPMTRDSRTAWSGRWAELDEGFTRYRWIGGVRGPVIVAIHGLTTPSEAWDEVAARLTTLGYRVLVYDLFGRGGSATVAGAQDAAFQLRQLRGLLDHLGLKDDLIVMGYSMGGQIAAAFAAEAPHRVQKLLLVAPAGLELSESRFDRFCRTWPIAGDWAQIVLGGPLLERVAADTAASGGSGPAIAEIQRAQLRRRGYLEAVLSSRRHLLSHDTDAVYRAVAAAGVPVLAIWGGRDAVIPSGAMGRLARLHRIAHHEVVEDAGHGLLWTHPDAVAAHVRDRLVNGA